MTSDLFLLAGASLLPVAFASALRIWRPTWSHRRMALSSAAPIPGLILLLCLLLFIRTASATPEQCGVDACGMAMVAAIYLAIAACVIFVAGAALTALLLRFAGKR